MCGGGKPPRQSFRAFFLDPLRCRVSNDSVDNFQFVFDRSDRGSTNDMMNIHAPSSPKLNLVRLPHGAGLDLPAYETAGAAGMDLRAAVEDDLPLTIAPGKRALVPTGFIFEIPEG